MATLLALDYPLGPELVDALRRCVQRSQAFCVLDQRLSRERRGEELAALGATHVLSSAGLYSVPGGTPVDEEVALVMLTSGSSGHPKAAELTWDALVSSAELTQRALARDRVSVWFPCLPANHIGGLAVLLREVLGDARLLWGDPHDVSGAGQRGATHVAVVRAQLHHHDLSAFDVVLLGGARPPGDVPDNVITTWGMTETGSGVVYNGRALDGVDVAAVNGEICVKSPTLFRSYRHSPRPRIVGPDGDPDWFPTGDGGEVTNGVVRVRGRLGHLINTGGEKLWPEDLEAVLAAVTGVRDIAVTSRPDDTWGEVVVALVVNDDHDLDQRLRDAALDGIGPWAKPREVRYVESIPRTANGKIRRAALSHLL